MFWKKENRPGPEDDNNRKAKASNPYVRRALTIALKVVLALILLAYLIANTVFNAGLMNLSYTSFSNEEVSQLPSPAFTLCADEVEYNFNCTMYGNTTKGCGNMIRYVNVSNNSDWNFFFTKCWVFGSTDPMFLEKPTVTPKKWSSHHSPLFVQYGFANASTISKMSLSIWNPFETPSGKSFNSESLTADDILDPYKLTLMESCRERVFSFYWTKHVWMNGSEKWDVSWRAESGIVSNAVGTNTSATGFIHFKPGTFTIPVTRDHPLIPSALPLVTAFFVLAAALWTCCWLPLAGRGKYRPWGLINHGTRYLPIKNIKPAMPTLKPTTDDIMRVYLYDAEKAEIN
jgi:hypothetical protein